MPTLLSRRNVPAKHQRTWWIIGVGSAAAACGTWLVFRARARAGAGRNTYPEAAVSQEITEITMPSSAPAPGERIAESRSMGTLVPGAYAVPDAAEALRPESAFPPDASVDAPPVGSVYSEPAPSADSPAGPDPGSAPVTRSGPEKEPWIEALRLAMEKEPLDLGYNRSAWTAPLLGRYLVETQGISVPLPRLRMALKELGYYWDHTHYVRIPGRMG